MTAMTLEQTQQNFPLDLSGLDNVTDPSEYDRIMHQAIQGQLQNGGLVGPTKNITNFQTDSSQDTPSFLEEMGETIFGMSPEVYDSSNKKAVGNYMQGRFDFIVGHEDYREKVYKDSLGKRTIGYGFNLDEPTNRGLFKKVLAKTDAEYDAALNGTASLSAADSRILFEASAGQAERLITQKFGDIPLKGYQRTALVSLAYNHPNLIGPNLTKAIRSGDLKAAEHEIRNRSNKYKIAGIANRRNLEADMFLGYGNDSGSSMFAKMFAPNAAQASQQPQDGMVSEVLQQVSNVAQKVKTTAVPSNIRALANDLLGMDLDDIAREDFFNDDQIASMQSIVTEKIKKTGNKKSGVIEYKDYESGNSGIYSAGFLGNIFNPEYGVKTTLGQFSYRVEQNGDVILTDQFNFNDAEKLQQANPDDLSKLKNLYAFSTSGQAGVYGMIRRIAALYGSKDGEGMKFEINIGKIGNLEV